MLCEHYITEKTTRVYESENLPSLAWKYLQGLQIVGVLAKNSHVQCAMYIQWLVNVRTPSIPMQMNQIETEPNFPFIRKLHVEFYVV